MKRYSKLIMLFGFMLFSACREPKKEAQLPNPRQNKTVKRFTVIEKDSAFNLNNTFDKSIDGNGAVIYKYTNDRASTFSVICDTARAEFKFITNSSGPIRLFVEKEKIFTVNGIDYKVFKLVADKDVMDGEITFFFNKDLGVFHFRSNTWRSGQLLNPEKEDAGYLQLTALLYKVLTDDEFYQKLVPQINYKKFTDPKVY